MANIRVKPAWELDVEASRVGLPSPRGMAPPDLRRHGATQRLPRPRGDGPSRSCGTRGGNAHKRSFVCPLWRCKFRYAR
jgi:hypothetical protein